MPGTRCSEDPDFASVLNRSVPPQLLAPAAEADLLARVAVLAGGSARIVVIDRISRSQVGSRELKLGAGDCHAMARAMGFTLTIMVEAGEGFLRPPAIAPEDPEPLPPPPLPPGEEDADDARASAPVALRRAQRYAWLGPRADHDLSASAGFNHGLLPGFALGASVAWRVRWSQSWPIGIHATGWKTSENAEGTGRFGAAYLGLLLCPLHVDITRIRGRLCPGLAGGVYWARSRGLARTAESRQQIWLAELELGFEIEIAGPLELVLLGRGDLPLFRPMFRYHGRDGTQPVLHQVAPVTASAFAGLGLRFR